MRFPSFYFQSLQILAPLNALGKHRMQMARLVLFNPFPRGWHPCQAPTTTYRGDSH